MKWRFISFKHYNPYFKTGLNKAIMEAVADNGRPVIFLSGWRPGCVNIGYSQNIEEEVDLEEAEKKGLVVVRRQGGGGTTYLTEDGEITWGIIAPRDYFSNDVNKIYSQVCEQIADGLAEIGIEAEHEPINDIVTENGKISGATLKRKDGVVYIGGTLLYDVSPEEMFSVLTPDEDKLKDKAVDDFRDRVSSVKNECGASFDETVAALKKGLLQHKEFEETGWTKDEKQRAEKLADKYRSEEWLYRK